MWDSREGRRSVERRSRPWLRLLALAWAPATILLLGAAAPAPAVAPTMSPSPSSSDSPPATGALQVRKTDPTGAVVTVPGAKFDVHRGTPQGQVVAKLVTDATGSAIARDLPIGDYCVEETAAPQGYVLTPTYTPDDCVAVAVGLVRTVSVADPPQPAATATPSPTPSPTPVPTGELQIVKTDTGGRTVSTPGFTFNVHVGSATGQVIATISTDGSGTAVAGALNPAVYCVEEISAPDGYRVAPSYSPSACVTVRADPTQGRSPTTITVADPAAPAPSASSESASGSIPSDSPAPGSGGPRVQPAAPGLALPVAALARGLVGLGAVLLLAGCVMIAVALRRRRAPREPPDYWYDSTIG